MPRNGAPLPTEIQPVYLPAEIIPQGSGGFFSSWRARRSEARRQEVMQAATATMESVQQYFDARTKAIESAFKAQEAEARLREFPLVDAHEQSRRTLARAEELAQLRHRHDTAELRRAAEHASQLATALAEQDLGPATTWKKQHAALLDAELAVEERRTVVREHIAELEKTAGRHNSAPSPYPDHAIEDALYEARARLRAHGLETESLDSLLEGRNGRMLRP